jgi:hypothetical protein
MPIVKRCERNRGLFSQRRCGAEGAQREKAPDHHCEGTNIGAAACTRGCEDRQESDDRCAPTDRAGAHRNDAERVRGECDRECVRSIKP